MSIHSSLKTKGKIQAKKSVLKRHERVNLLIEKGEWTQESSPFGLPKTKIVL